MPIRTEEEKAIIKRVKEWLEFDYDYGFKLKDDTPDNIKEDYKKAMDIIVNGMVIPQ